MYQTTDSGAPNRQTTQSLPPDTIATVTFGIIATILAGVAIYQAARYAAALMHHASDPPMELEAQGIPLIQQGSAGNEAEDVDVNVMRDTRVVANDHTPAAEAGHVDVTND